MAIIISKGGRNAKKIEKSGFAGESSLQEYIYDNPDSIPLYDIKEGIRLFIAAREFPTDSGPIDAIAFDRDGELYCIETKLFKNPDKRLVVAQVLDYGAALWRSNSEFAEFTDYLESFSQKSLKTGLISRMKEFFEINSEEATSILDNVRSNLDDGKFQFVVLMDRLHDRLKDLILFLNENCKFDVFAVEMEFYHHEQFEILIPKLFGAQVKKDVASRSNQTGRRKWDEASFFEDVSKNLNPQDLSAVKRLYEFSRSTADAVNWGSGKARGSFSPRYMNIAPRSLFSVFSDGTLALNFGWLGETEEMQKYRDALKTGVEQKLGLPMPSDYYDAYVNVPPEKWCSKVNGFIELVSAVTLKSGAAHAGN
jgi:hypothetical protein